MKSHDKKRDITKKILKDNSIKFKGICGLGYSSNPFANFYANIFDKEKLTNLFDNIKIKEVNDKIIECFVY